MGIPGVGKSTIVRLLMEARSITSPEFFSCDEMVRPPRWLLGRGILSKPAIRVLVGKHLTIAQALYRRPNDAEIRDSFQKLDPNFRKFIHHCLITSVNDFDYPEYQMMGFVWLAQVIEAYAILSSVERPNVRLIMEEGLGQKIHSIVPIKHEATERRKIFFELMPRPAAVVLLGAPIDLVFSRIINRRRSGKRLTLRHSYLSDSEIKCDLSKMHSVFEEGAEILKHRNVPVCIVNTSAPVGHCISNIRSFLHRIFIDRVES